MKSVVCQPKPCEFSVAPLRLDSLITSLKGKLLATMRLAAAVLILIPALIAPLGVAEPQAPVFRVGTISMASPQAQLLTEQWLAVVFEGLPFTPELELFPGRRLMIELNLGLIDADLGRRVDLSRGFSNVIRLNEPFIRVCTVMMSLADAGGDPQVLQNKNILIATFGGTPATQSELINNWPLATIVEFKTMEQAVNLLLHRRVDFVGIPHTHVKTIQQLSALPLNVYKVYPPRGANMHINSKHAALIPQLEAGMRRAAPIVDSLNCRPEQFSPITPYTDDGSSAG